MRGKKDSVKFIGRSHSKKGIASCIIGIILLILIIVLAVISGFERGQGGQSLGAIAIIGFLLSIDGFTMSISALKEKDVFFTAPIIGLSLNGGMFLLYMILYIIGLI